MLAGLVHTVFDEDLADLGRLDCRLQDAIGGLRAQQSDTHDQLQSHISVLVQDDVSAGMRKLVDAIYQARALADDVLADKIPRRQ